MVRSEASVDVAGHSVVLAYSSAGAEYEALHRRAIAVDRSHRGRLRFTGARAAEVLTGLLTNDVASLSPGQGQYTAALTAKGRIVADMRLLRIEDSYITDVAPRPREAWHALVRKYVNPRLAKYSDESESMRVVGIYGTQARYVVEQMTGVGHTALALLAPYSHISVALEDSQGIVMRSPDLGVEGYDLFVASDRFPKIWDAAIAARATPAGLTAWEIARVEAGRPEWGLDMDESTIAQEANLEQLGAISYTKGCYTGQEVVARIHFRGHVNRTLRGLRASGTTPPAYLAALFDSSGKAVGEVHSTASSPRFGGIALAMVRREVENGTQLMARWNADLAGDVAAGETQVDVVPLPFPT